MRILWDCIDSKIRIVLNLLWLCRAKRGVWLSANMWVIHALQSFVKMMITLDNYCCKSHTYYFYLRLVILQSWMNEVVWIEVYYLKKNIWLSAELLHIFTIKPLNATIVIVLEYLWNQAKGEKQIKVEWGRRGLKKPHSTCLSREKERFKSQFVL